VSAIKVEKNSVILDHKACVACGACTTLCPTEALIPLEPSDALLAENITTVGNNTLGKAVFACARIASKSIGDPETFAEVPCLSRIEESLLVGLAAQNISDITLVDGTCSTCKYHVNNEKIDEIVSSANTLLTMVGAEVQVKRMSEFPDFARGLAGVASYGHSRRSFFTQATDVAKETAKTTLISTLKKQFQINALESKRNKIGTGGTVEQFSVERRMHTLDGLDKLGSPQIENIETRLWGKVHVDTKKCNACTMCATFCPTGALKKIEEEKSGRKLRFLEFSMADCVQCNMCVDICLKKCLTVDTCISTEELFSFEPTIIALNEENQPNKAMSPSRP
jgi:formate hydrogenlyase subunit 6/NADH:ubiquinone oxidoreductase subunit I